MPRTITVAGVLLAALLAAQPGAEPRTFGLRDRVEAWRAIERVTYGHQLETRRHFDDAVPRSLLERKVRDQLSLSVALDRYWRAPVTADALQRELDRIAEQTLYPDRLAEIYAALDNDPHLILETFARASLVERLAHNFFDYDERIHRDARVEAEGLRADLAERRIDPAAPHPRRQVIERERPASDPGPDGPRAKAEDTAAATLTESGAPASSESRAGKRAGSREVVSESTSYEAQRALTPDVPGEIGNVVEERDAFAVRVLLEESESMARVATYRIPKVSFDEWWSGAARSFPPGSAREVAAKSTRLPQPGGTPREQRRRPGPPGGGSPPTDDGTNAQSQCMPDDTWDTSLFDPRPDALSGHVSIWTGTEMIVWGGREAGGYRYDPLIDVWRPISKANAPERGTAVWAGYAMLVWDGQAGTGARYYPGADVWVPISNENAPASRVGHTAVWTGERMIVFGGYDLLLQRAGLFVVTRTGGSYDPHADRWTPISSDNAPVIKGTRAAVWTGDLMVVWGGGYGESQGGRYHPATDTWLPMAAVGGPAGVSSQPGAFLFWTGKEVFAWVRQSGALYDPINDEWVRRVTNNPVPGYGTPVWTGKELIVWNLDQRRGARYDVEANTWAVVSESNAPSARYGDGTVLWAGDRLIAWGVDSTGGRYDPISDSWTPTARSAGPGAMMGHRGLWTGTEMIVWGGESTRAGRFDALTAQWRSISGVNAGSGGSIAWTGQEMIVWGGAREGYDYERGRFGYYVGGLYDPVADAWLPISSEGATQTRDSSFSTVWTGGDLIVWGGREADPGDDDDGYSNDGARYIPSLDRWLPISSDGAPTARGEHTAVWTVRGMLVWGGHGDSRDYDIEGGALYSPDDDAWHPVAEDHPGEEAPAVWTGTEAIFFRAGGQSRAYDPALDRWRPLTQKGQPRAMGSVTMVGDRMVVWGGRIDYWQGIVGTGARYDPATNTWTPMSTRNAPAARDGHSAVWTGRALIVWGGLLGGNSERITKSGGVYFLASDRDRDGYTDCSGDCDDTIAEAHPGAVDLPGDSLDQDCDGTISCDPSLDWASHDAFVNCVARECRALVRAGHAPRSACSDIIRDTSRALSCGDGALDAHEACDGADLGGATCESLGFDGGTLGCSPSCDRLELTGCTTVCGDGLRGGFETCDGGDLGGTTCEGLGFDSGELACTASCRSFNQSDCESVCGDGVRRGAEICDGSDLVGRTCQNLGFAGGSLACAAACDAVDTSACTTVCGDDLRGGAEFCDGADIGGVNCASLGFDGGEVVCEPSCGRLDDSGCFVCGDGLVEGDEVCDGENMGGSSCGLLGFEGGTLACDDECRGFIVTECVGCGNGVREENELCDGEDLGGNWCGSLGFSSGPLHCSPTCDGYDTSECANCGDGDIGGFERCDGDNFSGATCQSKGFDSGTLSCSTDCREILTGGCRSVCGDGVARGDEACDGGHFRWNSCRRDGYDGGDLRCNSDCTVDFSGCFVCGDGVAEFGEWCDGTDFGGKTCETLGFEGGTLTCQEYCRIGTWTCQGCDNGIIEEGEVCDDWNTGGMTCRSLGFDGGRLWCEKDCDAFDTSECSICGDGLVSGGEICDGAGIAGQTCESLGFEGGTLACAADCAGFDTTACTVTCGNGIRSGGEVCDGGDLGASCWSFGLEGGGSPVTPRVTAMTRAAASTAATASRKKANCAMAPRR